MSLSLQPIKTLDIQTKRERKPESGAFKANCPGLECLISHSLSFPELLSFHPHTRATAATRHPPFGATEVVTAQQVLFLGCELLESSLGNAAPVNFF